LGILRLLCRWARQRSGLQSCGRGPDAAHTAPLASTRQRISFDDFVDSVIAQERRLTDFMRNFKPLIETYIQEEGSAYRFQKGIIWNGDDYFLSRLDLTGNSPSIVPFADEETWNQSRLRTGIIS